MLHVLRDEGLVKRLWVTDTVVIVIPASQLHTPLHQPKFLRASRLSTRIKQITVDTDVVPSSGRLEVVGQRTRDTGAERVVRLPTDLYLQC